MLLFVTLGGYVYPSAAQETEFSGVGQERLCGFELSSLLLSFYTHSLIIHQRFLLSCS